LVCINPKILESSEEKIKDVEGCLSFPGLSLKVDRAESITAEWTDENGELKRAILRGVTARCFQHELDHMNGIKFTEHVGPVALKMAKQKQDKLLKKHIRKQKKK
jgi:peptide deformylase